MTSNLHIATKLRAPSIHLLFGEWVGDHEPQSVASMRSFE